MRTLSLASAKLILASRNRLQSLWSDESGESTAISQILSVVVGAFILLGVLFIFRNQIHNAVQDLLVNFFDQGADTLSGDQTTDVVVDTDYID